MELQCPGCPAKVDSASLPAAGTGMCPKCGELISVGDKVATGSASSSTPDNPFDFDLSAAAPASQDPFDFDKLPDSIDPLAQQQAVQQTPTKQDDLFFQEVTPVAKTAKTQSKKPAEKDGDAAQEALNQKITFGLAIAGTVFVLLGVIGATIASTGRKDPRSLKEEFVRKATRNNNVKDRKEKEAESLIDWKEIEKKDLAFKLPLGPSLTDFPTSVSWWGTRCRITRVVIFVAVSETDLGEDPTAEACAELCTELLRGEVVIKEPFERNGYKGYKATMGPTGYLPITKVELIPHAGRFVVNGFSTEAMREAKIPKMRALDVVTKFYHSLEINEYDPGWFGF